MLKILRYYKLGAQEAMTDDYYRIVTKILDLKNNNRDLKLRNNHQIW